MKRIHTLALLIAGAACLAPRVPDGFGMSVESPGVFGPVRSIRTETARYVFRSGKWVEGPRVLSWVLEVDPARRRITSTRILKDGAAADRTVFELDAAGRTVRKTALSADGKVHLVLTCEYDRDGRLAAKMVSHPLENRTTRIVSAYDPGGVLELTSFFPDPQSRAIKQTYAYDRAGREVERTLHDANGVLTTRVITRHDRRGNSTETWHEYAADGKVYTYTFGYDPHGNLTLQSFEPGEEERFSYEFDPYGNPLKMTRTLCNVTFGIFRQCRPESVVYSTITYYPENR